MAREFEKAGRYGNVECMMSRQQYIEYLLNTPVNYTCSNLAEHWDGVSHDAVSDFLQRGWLTVNRLWELVEPLLYNNRPFLLIFRSQAKVLDRSSIEAVSRFATRKLRQLHL